MSASNSTAIDSRQTASYPMVRKIGMDDLRAAIQGGITDFASSRTDVIFLCVVYPVIGIVLGRAASGAGFLPLLFPLASGFALVGPLAAVGLNEMSRRREMGRKVTWADAFRVLQSGSLGSIALLGGVLGCLLVAWLTVAQLLYHVTLGPMPPASPAAFIGDVLSTGPGHVLVVVGTILGFGFAVLSLAISVISFPLMLDREVGINVAVATSIRAVRANPVTMALWGGLVTAGLVLGSIPLFLGLIVVLPVLGHATWHLYRRVVV